MIDALRSIEAASAHLRVAVNDLDLHSDDPLLLKRAKLLHAQLDVFAAELTMAIQEQQATLAPADDDDLIANTRKLRLKLYGPQKRTAPARTGAA